MVRKGSRLVQLRVRRGRPTSSNAALRRLHEEVGFTVVPPGFPIQQELLEGGLAVTVDVVGNRRNGFVGYKARKHTPVIDVDRINHYNVRDFWDPVFTHRGQGIILDPDDFYILASREPVAVPPDQAAEMLAYDTGRGIPGALQASSIPALAWPRPTGRQPGRTRDAALARVPFRSTTAGSSAASSMSGCRRPDKPWRRDRQSYQSQGLALSSTSKAAATAWLAQIASPPFGPTRKTIFQAPSVTRSPSLLSRSRWRTAMNEISVWALSIGPHRASPRSRPWS
jgi:deoxycytidine triphosphate deaminase